MRSLIELDLSNNSFSGKVPPSIGNLSQLEILDFQRNHLIGTIPTELNMLANLKRLFVNDNNFIGKLLPHNICFSGKLESIIASNNHTTNAWKAATLRSFSHNNLSVLSPLHWIK
jgi:Leucine-rich repeat (LRR) protein